MMANKHKGLEIIMADAANKRQVRAHWEQEPCGTRGRSANDRAGYFSRLEQDRYSQEPHILGFARFEASRGLDVLEVGVGAGTDFVQWARCGARARGIDFTQSAVRLTRERLELESLPGDVQVADAEELPFDDASFDIVYAYGVIHHTPNTRKAVAEIYRVLRPGGRARIMIYGVPSWTGWMLWGVHALARMRPFRSQRGVIQDNLESPGTKAYSEAQAKSLFSRFRSVWIERALLSGDLLAQTPSKKYQGPVHRIAWKLYPRPIIRKFGTRFGLGLLIEAVK